MHPIAANRRRLTVFAAAWIPAGAALGVLPFWWSGGWMQDAWACVVWGEAFAIPLFAAAYVCRYSSPSTAGIPRVFTTVGIAALASAALWVEAGRLWFRMVRSIAPTPEELFGVMAAPAMSGAALLFVVMCAVYYVLAAGDDRQAAVGRALDASMAAREAELRALRAQVDPHFLFNCLHSISSLIGSDPALARTMCIELANFFRESLRAGRQPRITMADEAALVERYLDIERLRFGDRLTTTVVVADEAAGALVPPLLLQPLAENAVRHGVATLVDGGDVMITVSRAGDRIDITVENPFDADGRRNGTGLGLANVRARLESSYDGRASLRVHAADSRFYAAISLPLEELS